MAAKKRRSSAFVPRLLVRTAIVGVVPACAAGCGGSGGPTSPPFGYADAAGNDGSGDAQPDAGFLGVASVAYRGYEGGAPPDSGSSGAPDATPDARFPVWVLAATAYEVGAPKRT